MRLFLDTSALVPLLVAEVHTAAAQRAWRDADSIFAWEWMRVEAEAALLRRQLLGQTQTALNELCAAIHFVASPDGWIPELCRFNRPLRLRAADAGHVYMMSRCAESVPDLHLVTFDEEMKHAATVMSLPVWE